MNLEELKKNKALLAIGVIVNLIWITAIILLVTNYAHGQVLDHEGVTQFCILNNERLAMGENIPSTLTIEGYINQTTCDDTREYLDREKFMDKMLGRD